RKLRVGRIAFCTSIMNRLWQLKQTLPINLHVLRDTPHFISLCNYNSNDGLDEYLRESFRQQIEDGILVYFHTKEPERFHASIAKNTAHRLGCIHNAQFLFNLDADNFISGETIVSLEEEFSTEPNLVIHQWRLSTGVVDSFETGSFGRIGLST